ncbi:hypothetical protein RJT34_06421 [Clitoria ternatea]|uniref:Uncharacterized protein n=1 Tax=Clitoria ternatea TaxID=43366 RepID=A0AAN9K4T7_CLITE
MGVYEELEEAKAEIENLKVELRDKADSLQNLRRSYDAQANQIKEVIFKVEKLNQELLQKADEINEAKQLIEDLNGSLSNKESIIKHLNAANDKLGADCDDKFRNWEEEKQDLILVLEEANEKVKNQEQQMHKYRQEIGSLKGCLSASNKKCWEIERILKPSTELVEADDMFHNIEEKNMKVGEQLKRKNGQFIHLEEAHESEVSDLYQDEKCFQPLKLLEMKDVALITAQKDIHEEHGKAACLMRQVKSYKHTKQLQYSPQNKFGRHKEMLEESPKCQLPLKEKVLQLEIDVKEIIKEVYDSLDRENTELDERICEISEMELELQRWKSYGEHLNNDLEQNLMIRKELENSLLAQVDFSESLKLEKDSLVYKLEEKDNIIDYLQQHVFQLQQELNVNETEASVSTSGETAMSSEAVEVTYQQIIEEKNKILEEFQKDILRLEQESFRREFESPVIAKSNMERTNELENEDPIHVIEGKNMRTEELMHHLTSVEHNFTSFMTSFSSQLAQKQAEINQVQAACDFITSAEILAALEIEEKKLIIEELEDDIHDMEQKLKLQEENWRQSKQVALDIEAEMDAKQLRVKELVDQLENKLTGSDVFLQKLKIENKSVLENAIKLSSERENLLGFVLGLGDKMCECTNADTKLMEMLTSIVQSFENDCVGMNCKKGVELLVKENMIMHSLIGIKKPESFSDIRSPFKEINN